MVWPSKRFRDWTNGKILIDLTLYKTHICDLLLVLVEEMLLSPLACAELTPEYFSKHASPWQSSEGNFGSSVASKCSQTFVKDGGQLPMMKQVKRPVHHVHQRDEFVQQRYTHRTLQGASRCVDHSCRSKGPCFLKAHEVINVSFWFASRNYPKLMQYPLYDIRNKKGKWRNELWID